MKRVSVLTADQTLNPAFQLGILRNVERELSVRKRRSLQNWQIVRDYLLAATSCGGSTSCYQQCHFLGVDPEGHSFWG